MNANEHILNNIIWSNLDSEKDIFSKIYERNLWYSDESFSGKGSEKKSSENILNVLPKLFSELKIQTILDAPCGDYFWMKELKYSFKKYTGIDIVEELIKTNNLKYSNDKIEFMCLDIICNKLPKADLILCRDCFIHLSFENIFKLLSNEAKPSPPPIATILIFLSSILLSNNSLFKLTFLPLGLAFASAIA